MAELRVSANTEAQFTIGSGGGVREDLEDVIYRVSPYDSPLMTAAGRTKANQEAHEWLEDSLRAAVNTNSHQDGEKGTVVARVQPSRLLNRCQIFTDVMSITGRAQKAVKAGRADETAFLKLKAGLALKTDIEKTLLTNQAKVIGAAQTPPLLAGLPTWLKDNVSKAADGTNPTGDGTDTRSAGTARKLTEAMVSDLLAQIWANSNDAPSILLVPGSKKPQISAFGGNSTRMETASSKKLYAGIDVYYGDFSDVRITPDRFLPDAVSVYALNPDYIAVSWFRPMQTFQLSTQGDSEEWELLADCTLEVKNRKAHGVITDLS